MKTDLRDIGGLPLLVAVVIAAMVVEITAMVTEVFRPDGSVVWAKAVMAVAFAIAIGALYAFWIAGGRKIPDRRS